jgi:hypothetical protein
MAIVTPDPLTALGTQSAYAAVHVGRGAVTADAAHVVYVDSASPLGALPQLQLSTAVSLGAKFSDTGTAVSPTSQWQRGSCYYQCVLAGTTAASAQNWNIQPNNTFVHGTAQFKPRAFHGWDRACAGPTVPYWLQFYGKNCFIASTASFLPQANDDVPGRGNASTINDALEPVGSLVSVTKAADNQITTYASGAQIARGITYLDTQINTGPGRFVRGVRLKGTTGGAYPSYGAARAVRYGVFYDCTYEGTAVYADVSGSRSAAVDANNHSVRCTFKQLASTASVGGVMGYDEITDTTHMVVAPAATCAGTISALTGIINARAGNATLTVMGGDFSNLASGMSTNPSGVYGNYGGSTRLWGVKFAAGKLNTSRTDGAYLLNCTDGTTNYAAFEFIRNTTVYRSGGASDPNGAYSHSVTAHVLKVPAARMVFFNTKTDEGFVVSVDLLADLTGTGLANLSAEDIWMEIAYPDQTDTWHGGFAMTRNKDNWQGFIHDHATGPAALSASPATWVGQPAGSVKYRLSATINPRRAGAIQVVVYARLCPWTLHHSTLASMRLYIDPTVTLSAAP